MPIMLIIWTVEKPFPDLANVQTWSFRHTKSIFRKDFTRSILFFGYRLSAVSHTLATEKIFISSDELLVIVKLE